MKKDSKATIKIPRALYNRLKDIIEGSGFDSVTDFVVYILRDIAGNIDPDKFPDKLTEKEARLTAEEVEKVRQRLKTLGYL